MNILYPSQKIAHFTFKPLSISHKTNYCVVVYFYFSHTSVRRHYCNLCSGFDTVICFIGTDNSLRVYKTSTKTIRDCRERLIFPVRYAIVHKMLILISQVA